MYNMNRNIRILLGVAGLFLFPAFACAERISTPHDFQSMVTKSELSTANSNTTILTGFATYQCTGTGARMWKDLASNTYWSINLPKNSSSFVTTTRINELTEFRIAHYPASTCTDIKIYVTTDSLSWGAALTTDNVTYSSGAIDVTIPRNNYYVRIKNTATSKDVSILRIVWYQDHCNCFTYEPE